MKTKINLYIYLVYLNAVVILCSLPLGSLNAKSLPQDEKKYTCQVKPVSALVTINAQWDKNPWNVTKAEKLTNFMGDKPAHFPDTQFKVRYNDKNIYVIFQVKDQYVKAVAKEIHGRVCEDSCVEFFFTPGTDISRGYFNLETNCKGIFLLSYTKNSNGDRGSVDLVDCKKIIISNSLQQNAETEITGPVTWSIEYAVPFAMLEKYIKVDKPAKGVKWRANFFKCADKTSHPHWLT